MRRKNDILLKSAFEEAFPDLLRFFFKEADSIFDIERGFEFMDKELSELFPELERKGGSRFVDMLVKTYLIDGTEEWILVHLEIQGEGSNNFAFRMFQYWYRIYDRYENDIVALAVFTGGKNQKRPAHFHKSFLGTEIQYKYNAYHILDDSEEELLAMNNPFALIILAAQKALLMDKIPEQELGEQRLTIARALIESKKYNNEQIRRFLFFLKTFIHIDNQEINTKFDKEIDILTKNRHAMGIIETIKMLSEEEGIEKGIEKGKITILKSLLQNTDFDNSKIATLCDVPEELVNRVQRDLHI
jgi:predicted transposase/invertase (TIGR01784 family)